MQHLLSIDDLDHVQIQNIFQQARLHPRWMRGLKDCVVACLFFEPSTRTSLSFELAAKKLGATVLTPNLEFSSLQKGESILDTVKTVIALGANIVVLRHKQTGIVSEVAHAQFSQNTALINAGDGMGQHPTQALTDLYTILEHKGFNENFSWARQRVAIVGDSKHSRVANSLISALKIMGCNDICLIGPEHMLADANGVACANTMQTGLKDRNIIIALRNQVERWHDNTQADNKAYAENFMITSNAMQYATDDAILMHPGPVRADFEIAKDLLAHKNCLIDRQISNGVIIRQALLNMLWQEQSCVHKNNYFTPA